MALRAMCKYSTLLTGSGRKEGSRDLKTADWLDLPTPLEGIVVSPGLMTVLARLNLAFDGSALA